MVDSGLNFGPSLHMHRDLGQPSSPNASLVTCSASLRALGSDVHALDSAGQALAVTLPPHTLSPKGPLQVDFKCEEELSEERRLS